MEFKTLKKKDYKKAIQYAVVGMHFNWYMNNPSLLKLYGRYFLYLELNRATQVIAAYEGDELAGVLLAEMYGEKPCCKSIGKQIYAGIFHRLQHIFVKGGVDCYDKANENMRNEYLQNHTPDGELIFLAANPRIKRKGTGSLLLAELEKREAGKVIYLYTDNACTYQFYEHRGFARFAERNIVLNLNKTVPLTCYFYTKQL